MIAEQWASYHAEVVPPTAPDIQREECKRAFYAGASAMLTEVMIATEPVNVETAEARLQALEAELLDYIRLFKSREAV